MMPFSPTTRRTRQRPMPPGPVRYPWLGMLPQMRRDSLRFLTAMARTCGDIVSLPLGPLRAYLFCHPDHIAHILQDNHRNYAKSQFMEQVKPLLGEGLVTSDGDMWRTQRRLVQPAFHRQRIAALAGTITTATQDMLARWARLAAAGTSLDLLAEMRRLTGEVIVRALFGTTLPEAGGTVFADFTTVMSYMRTRMLALTTWGAHLPTPGRRRFTAALARLNTMVWQLIEEQRQSGGDRGDLLSLLLASHDPATGERMPAQRVRDEVMTLVFAGHETTALALTWTWYVLARHAEATDRLLREVAGVLAGRVPTMADLPHLPYTRMVLEEALRLYPPVWMIARAARADNVIDGYPIPAQTTIFLSPYITHRHPAFWADPERFDPERFAPHQTVSRPPCTYFPFAAGPRACLGAQLAMVEAQLILAQVIQVYGVDVIAGQRITPQPVLTLQPRNGVHVILRPRSARGS